MIKLFRHLARDRKGAAAVEFSLAIPIALTLILGCMNFGIYLFFKNSVATAIDETARSAMLWPIPDDAQLATNFENSLLTAKTFGTAQLQVAHGTSTDGRDYVDLTGTGGYRINLIFVDLGTIPVRSTRRAFVQA
ncbi:TadE/TadG family type IV pilus assembly protein [Qipengyuania zhejiangensis]|uniref:TadE/TadG family type IV pilus assembly protein n=1 Tax=Qipengyuania zhejiangensis TaxID=3077782 RepID=UPI002D76D991|nr:TadE/TadG family type IV pilus assembly protein [Qipengyuania sp. Z2]